MERSTASSRLSFHRTGPRCPTSVYVNYDDDDDAFCLETIFERKLIKIKETAISVES
jgi:hypothetical protein